MNHRLYRSTTDKMVGGVCGGLANYLGIDPIFIRLFFVLLVFGNGSGIWLYVALWILVQPAPALEGAVAEANWDDAGEEFSNRARAMGDDVRAAVRKPHPQTGLIVGGGLIILGVIQLFDNLHIQLFRWLEWDYVWPALLIIGGIVWIVRGVRGGEKNV